MVRLTGVFSQIGSHKVMVVGDLMLDTYTIGKARRISPEAPVAVVHVQREEHRPGGAGNVILNLISMGAEVIAIGRVGHDTAGSLLRQALADEGVNIQGIMEQLGFPTPVKNRILAENQQIVRVDHESVMSLSEQLEDKILAVLPELLEGVKVIALSDYGKGFLSRKLLEGLIKLAKQRGIPVIADPKGLDFTKYNGSTVIKPNLGEAYAAANFSLDTPLEDVATRILEIARADYLMVTRSEAGISIFHNSGSRLDFPVRVREVKDVTGAGDTVLAMLTCALANGLPMPIAVQLSNVAAGIAIERFGCARVTLSDLARRLLEDDVGNKVFDEEHLFALKEALRGRRCALLSISGSQGLTSSIFSNIRSLSKDKDKDLLIHVRDEKPDPEFVSLLASLHEVDFIILKSESLKSLDIAMTLDEVHILENGECRRMKSIHDVFVI
jgi:rfaE bifunctional protein kinase chain/domain